MNLDKLLRPKSMAVVGATEKFGPGNFAAKSAVQGANSDRVYYVNPKRNELFGRKCYHSLDELPEVVDCILLCTSAKTVAGYLDECGQKGIGAAVVYASGFEEERTEEAQALAREVKSICDKYADLAVEGPNCIGFVNAVDNICGAMTTKGMLNNGTARGIAMIAQSGYITNGFTDGFPERMAYMVSAGNCTKCSLEDYMLYFSEDERVTAIAAYIEGIHKPEIFEKALRICAEKRKPVIVLKTGMTEQGTFAAASHTGSLAGDYKIFEAIFKKYGVILTESLEEFVSTTRAFAILDGNFPDKPGIGAINFSGGENTLCADTCGRIGISLPQFSSHTIEQIKKVVPSFSTAANPLDATTSLFTEVEKVHTLFSAITNDPNIGLVTLGNDVGIPSEHKDISCAQVISDMKAKGELGPCVIVPSIERPRNEEVRKAFENAGCPVLSTGDFAYKVIKHIIDFSLFVPEKDELTIAIRTSQPKQGKEILSESASKAELIKYGIRIPKQMLAETKNEISKALEFVGLPAVMKVESADITHKTDAGGVKLNIMSVEDGEKAFDEILTSCRNYKADANIDGIMIQEQIPEGVEMIIGINNDKQFGPIMLVGLGGVFTELFKDTALYPCPVSKKAALAMLKNLKGYKLLEGYRGSTPKSIDVLAEMMVAVSDYAVSNKDIISEMDLNPVVVLENNAIALDALIIKEK